MHGEKEIEYGRTAPIVAYPFVDNGGRTIRRHLPLSAS